jgi:hypothetical protein
MFTAVATRRIVRERCDATKRALMAGKAESAEKAVVRVETAQNPCAIDNLE